MLTNIWSVTLFICSIAVLFLLGRATITAVKVLRFWDSSSDSALQIKLESETWLSAALVQSSLAIQLVSLLLLVLAADEFSHVLAGAMCATGAFLANDYGFPSLLIKVAAIFLYGFWIVLHRFDMQSEYSPLTRVKHIYILALLPVIGADLYYQTLYLSGLTPDIITSCCGTLFSSVDSGGIILTENYSVASLLFWYYLIAILSLLIQAIIVYRENRRLAIGFLHWLNGGIWLIFFPYALLVITMVISSYIYAMPYHHCPFDILRGQYNGIGYPIYITLFSGAFFGISGSLAVLFSSWKGLEEVVARYRTLSVKLGLVLLLSFLIFTSYPILKYYYHGGETVF